MTLLNFQQKEKLLENGNNPDKDHPPVVRIHIPENGCHWLLSKLNPICEDTAFGLCDLGMGFPELGWVELNKIPEFATILIVNDCKFEGKYPLSVYADAAREMSKIIIDETILLRHRKVSKP